MQFVNIRELSRATSKYLKMANEDNEIIITRNGHPYAILQKMDSEELQDFIISRHLNLNQEFSAAVKEHALGKTVNARDLLEQITND